MARQNQALNWCGTLNNPTEAELRKLHEVLTGHLPTLGVTHLAAQFEAGTGAHTPHIQLYVCLTNKKRFSFLQALFNTNRFHWEIRSKRSTHAQASAYCNKDTNDDGTPARLTLTQYQAACPWDTRDLTTVPLQDLVGPWSVGNLPIETGQRPGKREFVQRMMAGERPDTIATSDQEMAVSYVQYTRGYEAFQTVLDARAAVLDRPTLDVTVYLGPAGSGKSTLAWARARANPNGYFSFTPSGTAKLGWFDGAAGKGTLLLDDFHHDWFSYEWFMRLLDKYPVRLATKGSHCFAAWTTVLITTCTPIEEWYPLKLDKSELLRRVTHLEHVAPRAPQGLLALQGGLLVAAPPPPAPLPGPQPIPQGRHHDYAWSQEPSFRVILARKLGSTSLGRPTHPTSP